MCILLITINRYALFRDHKSDYKPIKFGDSVARRSSLFKKLKNRNANDQITIAIVFVVSKVTI